MNDKPEEDKSEFYPPYSEFSKTLRTWFVAYGIGGPVVLLANEKAWPNIITSGLSYSIGILFLTGGALQIVSALLNKHAMWHLYSCEEAHYDGEKGKANKERRKKEWPYKLSDWYSEQNWIDELLDIYTLILFAWATWLTFRILVSPPGQYIYDGNKSWYAWRIGVFVAFLPFVLKAFSAYLGKWKRSRN